MRKLLWWGVAGCTFVTASAYSLAQVAIHHPETPLGQMVLNGAARLTTASISGSAVMEQSECQRLPVCAEETCEIHEVNGQDSTIPVVTDTPRSMAIVIPEEEAIPAAEMPVLPDSRCPVRHVAGFAAETECPPSEIAPLNMPYASEEEACEELPAPKAVEEFDAEEQEEIEEPATGSANRVLRLFEKLIKKAPRPEASLPRENPVKPTMNPTRSLKTRINEFAPVKGEVDTMEFRASDRALYDFGPGSL